ncbi:MAG: hypothetical protein KDA89_09565 [Planctomycetaceae bacterium]|nr:hypothetical protein [Planctomycetaceae bacterium]
MRVESAERDSLVAHVDARKLRVSEKLAYGFAGPGRDPAQAMGLNGPNGFHWSRYVRLRVSEKLAYSFAAALWRADPGKTSKSAAWAEGL